MWIGHHASWIQEHRDARQQEKAYADSNEEAKDADLPEYVPRTSPHQKYSSFLLLRRSFFFEHVLSSL